MRTSYIALLRGINVGGHTIKMDVLRQLFTEMGFENVRSYIQSGNIFFDINGQDESFLKNKIEKHLESALGYKVPTCLRTVRELEKLISTDPFRGIELTPDKRFSVQLLTEPSTIDLPVPFITTDGGYELVGKTATELFVVWHLKNGRPGNSYGQIEKKLHVPTTTRFWHTLIKILTEAKKES